MKPRIGLVAASPLTARVFLAPHIAALRSRYSVTLIADLRTADPATAVAADAAHSVPIARKIAPLADLAALFGLVRVFRGARFAAVQSVTPKAGLLGMLAGALTGVPVRIHIFTGQVWVTRSGLARQFLKCMDRLIAALATHVLVDSRSQRDFLLAQGIVSAEKSRVLAKGSISGVDPERFRPDAAIRSAVRADLGLPEASVVFLYLGRLNRDKGLLDLAAAFARACAGRSDLRLVVAGPDEDGIAAGMRAALGAAADHARFVSYTDRPEDYMAAADAFCLPSYREGFGSTVIEAAACGIPAIGSRIYGITDAIEENATGLLFDPGDAEMLSRCMLRLAAEPALRKALGERARERALRDFRTADIVAELTRFYEQALGRAPRQPG